MKKHVFLTMVAFAAMSLTFAGYKVSSLTGNSTNPLLHENIEALSSGGDAANSVPSCTGPKDKETKVCECTNTNPCRDLYGCS